MINIREDFNVALDSYSLAGSPIEEILQDVKEFRALVPIEAEPIIKLFHITSPLVIMMDIIYSQINYSDGVIQLPIVTVEGSAPEANKVVLGPGVFLYEVYLDSTVSPLIDNPAFLGYLDSNPLVLEAFKTAITAIGGPPTAFSLNHLKNVTHVLANTLRVGVVFRRFAPGYFAEIGAISFDYDEELYQDTDYTGSLSDIVTEARKQALFYRLKTSFQEAIQTRANEFNAIKIPVSPLIPR